MAALKSLSTKDNFLGIEEKKYYDYSSSKYVIQQVPYNIHPPIWQAVLKDRAQWLRLRNL